MNDQPELPWDDDPEPEPRKRKGKKPKRPAPKMPVTRGDGTTLDAAHDWLFERAEIRPGAICPCCTRLTLIYNRPLNSNMARGIIKVYRASGRDWCHIPDVLGYGDEFTRLSAWGLIVAPDDVEREDTGKAGIWRITEKGEQWVRGTLAIPQYARIFKAEGELHGQPTTISDALGNDFDYYDLMFGGEG